jgi:hypothetical protein
MTDITPAVIIGSIFFAYIHIFNKTMDVYKKTDYTMTWNEYIQELKQRMNPYK